jgi:SAM-dependent methyltransferase
MSPTERHEPVERFDRIWTGWADQGPKDERIAQHREERARFLRALYDAAARAPIPRTLEVGCGSAIDLALLAADVPGLAPVGVDISVPAVQVARTFAAHQRVRLALCVGDAFALPFRSSAFGFVFSQGVLEHFRDPAPTVREQLRVLAAGGIFIVNVPQRWTGYTLHKRRAIRRGTWPWGWEGSFSPAQLRRLGAAQGLECLEVFGYQYWRAWGEPAWVLRDLYGKIHRRNPLAGRAPFPWVARRYDGLWTRLEGWCGRWFLQNVVAVFRKPGGPA